MVPVIINNRNLFTWPKKMIEFISKFEMVGEIIILDNGSTYQPLLDWYEEVDVTVIKIQNMGHSAPWDSGLVERLNSEYYVVTDSDLDISMTPKDCISESINVLKNFPEYGKVGLSFIYEDVPENSPYYHHIQTYEKERQLKSFRKENHLVDVGIDTTFAVYNIKKYFIGGASLINHRAKHIPWYFTVEERNTNEEFSNYLKTANNSCSYKTFLNL